MKIDSVLFIDHSEIDENFFIASKNVPKVDVLPLAGLNVYDILKRDFLSFFRECINWHPRKVY